MQQNADHVLDVILASEGGFVNDPRDRGGATNYGITQKTLSAWRGRQVTVDDVRLLTEGDAREILTAQYLTPIRFDILPAGLDLCVADCSTNSGPDRAIKLLQMALGMKGQDVDGVLGLHTRSVLDATTDIDGLIVSYCAARLAFMKKLRSWSAFGDGWTARVTRVQTESIMLGGGFAAPTRDRVQDPSASAKAIGPTKIIAIPSGQAVVATAGTVAASAVTAAAQASGILQPFSGVQIVRNCLLVLALASAAATVVLTLVRTKAGATL